MPLSWIDDYKSKVNVKINFDSVIKLNKLIWKCEFLIFITLFTTE
jgi:hypothetical protein